MLEHLRKRDMDSYYEEQRRYRKSLFKIFPDGQC